MGSQTLMLRDGNDQIHVRACYPKEETTDRLLRTSVGGSLKFSVFFPVNSVRNNNTERIIRQRLEMFCPAYHNKKDTLSVVEKNIVYLLPLEKMGCSIVEMTIAEANQYKHWNMLVESDFISSLINYPNKT